MLVAHSDDLKSAVDRCSETIADTIPGLSIHFVHYLSGLSTYPYSLRRTAMWVNQESWFAGLDEGTRAGAAKQVHESTLIDYIRYFDRKNTFLNLAIGMLSRHAEQRRLIGTVRVNRETDAGSPLLVIKPAAVGQTEMDGIEWTLDQGAADLLAPAECVRKFFLDLYGGAGGVIDWRQVFELTKAELFGRCAAGPAHPAPDTLERFPDLLDLWNAIASIQSSLLYFRAAATRKTEGGAETEESPPSGSVIAIQSRRTEPRRGAATEEEVEFAVAIVSPALDDLPEAAGGRDKLVNIIDLSLRQMLVQVGLLRKSGEGAVDRIGQCLNLSGGLRKNLSQSLSRSLGRAETYDRYLQYYSHWALLVMHQLKEQVHEGQLLSFYIVCGELSEFQDCPNTWFRELPADDLKRLRLLDSEEIDREAAALSDRDDYEKAVLQVITRQAGKVADVIAKEHYPWFERGRHALLWNVAACDPKPAGLVSFLTSSWASVVDERLRGRTAVDVPDCAIAFASGDPQDVGLLTVSRLDAIAAAGGDVANVEFLVQANRGFRGNYALGSRVSEIVRWRGNNWVLISSDLRRKALKDDLIDILATDAAESSALDKVINIIMRVADDPRKGGTIVFLNEGYEARFEPMGTPWRPAGTLTDDDLIALIGQDGATLHPLPTGEWEHRRLLTPDPASLDKLKRLAEQVAGSPEKRWPLEHKGSRRWSAALTAFQPSVAAVIVISQDGDVQIWHEATSRDGDGDLVEVRVIEIPMHDSPRMILHEKLLVSRS
ncbi:MAG: hypothetical protein H0T47_16715 [Planctomycetaceae bacterium]|nr:hypothetical protein [Planctomycetaceae bacterium]